jgi:tRNA pseudouridine55 synthase
MVGDTKLISQNIGQVLQDFAGTITQIPPMYSALKHQGKSLYTYAREGVEIERKPRQVTIYDLKIAALVGEEMSIKVSCSTGTYIRTLAEDIGRALGCGGAYLTALRRSAVHDFSLSQSYTLDQIEGMSLSQRDICLYSTDRLLHNFSAVTLESMQVKLLLQGQIVTSPVSVNGLIVGEKVRMYDTEENFLGLGEITAEGEIAPKRLISGETLTSRGGQS